MTDFLTTTDGYESYDASYDEPEIVGCCGSTAAVAEAYEPTAYDAGAYEPTAYDAGTYEPTNDASMVIPAGQPGGYGYDATAAVAEPLFADQANDASMVIPAGQPGGYDFDPTQSVVQAPVFETAASSASGDGFDPGAEFGFVGGDHLAGAMTIGGGDASFDDAITSFGQGSMTIGGPDASFHDEITSLGQGSMTIGGTLLGASGTGTLQSSALELFAAGERNGDPMAMAAAMQVINSANYASAIWAAPDNVVIGRWY